MVCSLACSYQLEAAAVDCWQWALWTGLKKLLLLLNERPGTDWRTLCSKLLRCCSCKEYLSWWVSSVFEDTMQANGRFVSVTPLRSLIMMPKACAQVIRVMNWCTGVYFMPTSFVFSHFAAFLWQSMRFDYWGWGSLAERVATVELWTRCHGVDRDLDQLAALE